MPTRQYHVIREVLDDNGGHMTADQVYEKARIKMPSIAVGTVYRNLNGMVTSGELKKVDMVGGPDLFDVKLEKHDHAICRECGGVFDVRIPGIEQRIKTGIGDRFRGYMLNIDYVCPDCLKKIQKR